MIDHTKILSLDQDTLTIGKLRTGRWTRILNFEVADIPVLLVVQVQSASPYGCWLSFWTASSVPVEDGIGLGRRAAADLSGGWTIIRDGNRRGTGS